MDPQAYGCCLSALTRFTRDPSHGVRPSSPGGDADNGCRNALGKEFRPAEAGCRYREPLAPHVARPCFQRTLSPRGPLYRAGAANREKTHGGTLRVHLKKVASGATAPARTVVPILSGRPVRGTRPPPVAAEQPWHPRPAGCLARSTAADYGRRGTHNRMRGSRGSTRRPSRGTRPSRHRARSPSGPHIPSRCVRAGCPLRGSPRGCRERRASSRRRRRWRF